MAKKLFLYMAKRDKKGVRVLTTFECEDYTTVPATRVQDLSTLNLPKNLEAEIRKTLYQNRLLWEAWAETAEDYSALRTSLKSRGYVNLSVYANALHPIRCEVLVGEQDNGPVPSTRGLTGSAQPTMIRKAT